ncbi:MAG: orotidine-5'-phosphate decarboxylase [Caldisericia bacterium]|nr:orotidine-5'-phosphate decarboxylase [Caldisericia bacterium]
MNAAERLIIGLDLEKEKALELVKTIPNGPIFKIGMTLFTPHGRDFVKQVIDMGHKVFLDMKFHDIPNVVANAAEAVADMGATMFTIHASGGPTMIKGVRERLDKWSQKTGKKPPIVLGVTVLTSLDQNELNAIGHDKSPNELVEKLAGMAIANGCDGIVCSPQEIENLRAKFGKDFVAVTPGIRRGSDAVGDQKRVATPESAIKSGSTYIVVARPIVEDSNPKQATLDFIKEIENAI